MASSSTPQNLASKDSQQCLTCPACSHQFGVVSADGTIAQFLENEKRLLGQIEVLRQVIQKKDQQLVKALEQLLAETLGGIKCALCQKCEKCKLQQNEFSVHLTKISEDRKKLGKLERDIKDLETEVNARRKSYQKGSTGVNAEVQALQGGLGKAREASKDQEGKLGGVEEVVAFAKLLESELSVARQLLDTQSKQAALTNQDLSNAKAQLAIGQGIQNETTKLQEEDQELVAQIGPVASALAALIKSLEDEIAKNGEASAQQAKAEEESNQNVKMSENASVGSSMCSEAANALKGLEASAQALKADSDKAASEGQAKIAPLQESANAARQQITGMGKPRGEAALSALVKLLETELESARQISGLSGGVSVEKVQALSAQLQSVTAQVQEIAKNENRACSYANKALQPVLAAVAEILKSLEATAAQSAAAQSEVTARISAVETELDAAKKAIENISKMRDMDFTRDPKDAKTIGSSFEHQILDVFAHDPITDALVVSRCDFKNGRYPYLAVDPETGAMSTFLSNTRFDQLSSMAFDSQGRLHIGVGGDYGGVFVYDSNQKNVFSYTTSADGRVKPNFIAADHINKTMHVVDRTKDKIRVFSETDGALLYCYGFDGQQPQSIAVDAARDRVYVTDRGHEYINVFTLRGEPVEVTGFGRTPFGPESNRLLSKYTHMISRKIFVHGPSGQVVIAHKPYDTSVCPVVDIFKPNGEWASGFMTEYHSSILGLWVSDEGKIYINFGAGTGIKVY